MTSPFDPNFKPTVDVAPIKKAKSISRASASRRARDLQSDDPEVVRRAKVCLGDLSSKGLSPEYVRGRKKGER